MLYTQNKYLNSSPFNEETFKSILLDLKLNGFDYTKINYDRKELSKVTSLSSYMSEIICQVLTSTIDKDVVALNEIDHDLHRLYLNVFTCNITHIRSNYQIIFVILEYNHITTFDKFPYKSAILKIKSLYSGFMIDDIAADKFKETIEILDTHIKLI